MALSLNQIKAGQIVEIEGTLFQVVEHQHIKPGKGAAFAKIKIKNIKTNQVLERTIKPADRVEDVYLEERRMSYSYDKGDSLVFMDTTSFEELEIPKHVLGEGIHFLQDNIEAIGIFHNDQILKVDLPNFIVAEITHTEPGFRGDTSKAGNKPATIATGATIQVPLFIEIGDQVKVDTRSGSYVERVKK